MGRTVAIVSQDLELIEALRVRLGLHSELAVYRNLSDMEARQAAPSETVLVHLAAGTLNGDRPTAFMHRARRLAGEGTLVGLLARDCPTRLGRVAQKTADLVSREPIDPAALAELVQRERNIHPMLEPMFAQWGYRSIRAGGLAFVTFEPHLFAMLDELSMAAVHDVTVLLTGETGAGKTHLSRLIHALSPRREERFCTVACGALPSELIEAELFGHVKGAFTGAERDREGKFAAAGRGTLLLDEIDLLTLEQQAKLLRVIETGEYEPVGSNDTQLAQARIVVASNHALEDLVESGRFRKDLFYRLNILRFELTPLRERPLDLEYLARSFAVRYSQEYRIALEEIDPETIGLLKAYRWPGNIRELENVIRRAVLYCREGILRPADLPASVRQNASAGKLRIQSSANRPITLAERKELSERQIIEETLRRNNHRRSVVAAELGISRVTLYHKMKKFGLMD